MTYERAAALFPMCCADAMHEQIERTGGGTIGDLEAAVRSELDLFGSGEPGHISGQEYRECCEYLAWLRNNKALA